jgi:amidohydrolase
VSAVDLLGEVERLTKQVEGDAIALRRDLHAHPELGRAEVRTTRVLAGRLRLAGLEPRLLPGTGLVCDIDPTHAPAPAGAPDESPDEPPDAPAAAARLALRADIDALPVRDEKPVPYRSTVPGVCHACGHDVHSAAVLGAGLVLAEMARDGLLPRPVRLIFQPAEEIMPGGAQDVIEAGGLDGVDRILALHCDPRLDTGRLGLTVGPITSASDRILVRLSGAGGHTARPHLTQDVVHALGVLVSQLPAVLGRRLDPRAGVSLVWGRVNAGHVANAIPAEGWAEGTIRCLDPNAWETAPGLAAELAEQLVAPFGVTAEVDTYRGVPPVVNDAASVELMRAAALGVLGPDGAVPTDQSLGAEDFAWYLEKVPGALARLGVRRPGDTRAADLHQGTFDPDEDAIGLAVQLLATCAVLPSPQSLRH